MAKCYTTLYFCWNYIFIFELIQIQKQSLHLPKIVQSKKYMLRNLNLFPARTRLINYSTSNSGLRKLGTSTISIIKKEIICLGFPLFFSSMQFFSVTQILSIYIKGIKRRVRQSSFDSIQHKTWYFLIENYKTFCVWYIHTYIYILDFAKKSSTK